MKNIFLSIFLLIIGTISLKAQPPCTFYGYYVDASGFTCGESPGRLCILTNYDWACHDGDYEIQISFPTGAFIFTDLGDFSVLTSNNQTTTLHATLSPPSHGLAYYCLEGVIQVPGTVFSAQVVSLFTPTVVLNPTTFTLDVAAVIGSNVGVPTISQAITQQLILDPSVSGQTGQRVIVDGALSVDENYAFGSFFNGGMTNEIKMKPGASITIASGVTLSTKRTNITGCEGSWEGIRISGGGVLTSATTNIQDAKTAIELLDLAALYLLGSHLSHNDVGIASLGNNPKTITLNIVPGNPILGTTSSIRSGSEGIHLEQVVSPIILTGLFSISNMSKHGIYLDKTDLTASNVWFSKCEYGIRVGTSNDLLNISKCRFDDGYAGIFSQGTLEMQVIDDNMFSNMDYAVVRTTALANDHTLIENNYFDFSCQYDVVGIVQPSRAEIQFNELYADRGNVLVWGLGTGKHQWATQYNENMFAGLINTTGYNVWLFNTTDARIFHNTLPYGSQYNFNVSGGSLNKIGYNTGCISDAKNIQSIGSPKGIIYCNELDGENGITIQNDCAGTEIRGNRMTGWAANLVYGAATNAYANTGPQPYKGNIFDASSEGNPKAINFSSSTVAADNQYQVGFFAGPQGSALNPFFVSNFNKWFLKDEEGLDYSCPDGGIVEDPREKALESSVAANIQVLENGLERVYGPEIAFDAQLKLYRDLEALKNTSGLTSAGERWHGQLAKTEVAQFVAFENLYQSLIALTETEQSTLQALAANVRSTTDAIKAIQWYTFEPSREILILDPVQKSNYDAKIQERERYMAAIKAIVQPKHTNMVGQLSALKAILNSIPSPATLSAQNLKTANNFWLSRLNPAFVGFSESERGVLRHIANQCVGQGGEGVYIARALLAESTLDFPTYNDACIPAAQIAPRAGETMQSPQTAGLAVSPNPANGEIRVSLPESKEARAVQVADLFGKIVLTHNVPSETNEVRIDITALPPGIYFVQSSGLHQTIKLVVAR